MGPAQAASGDADGTYQVTITKLELSTDGTTFVTVFEGSQAINIAAANAGAVAAGLVSGVTLAAGTYTTVRATLGANLLAKGYVNNGADTIYTNNSANGSTTNSGVNNTPGADYAISTYTIPSANRTNTMTGLSFIVQPGVSKTVKVSFDTSGVLSISNGVIIPGAPSVTSSAS
ncbi:MAG: hypothetical protein HY595_04400 [Candidatus Omnitrophica bacterium]|nr:hypothetical protein [Candidatus Omnitrophota bacterium]